MTPEKLAAEIYRALLSSEKPCGVDDIAAIIRKHEHEREAELRRVLTTRIGAWQTIPEVLRTLATGKFDRVFVAEWAKEYSPLLDAALNPKGPTQ